MVQPNIGIFTKSNSTSKYLKVSLLDNIKQIIKQKKQQTKLVTIFARIDGKNSSLKTLFDWAMSTFYQTIQTLFMRAHGYFKIGLKSKKNKIKGTLIGSFFISKQLNFHKPLVYFTKYSNTHLYNQP